MSELLYRSATQLAAAIKSREVSSVELTQAYIDRIEQHDDKINAVVVRTFERALEDAAKADEVIAKDRDPLGPLHGVPMTIKESYVIKDTPSTWGIDAFRNNVSATDGLAVSRFRTAGAHFLGKTNVPVELADFQSYNAIYGTTGNPYDTTRTPGGSSGGSAAALAAGFSALEAGSDIGGSIRNPAHFCGVFGHKPTYGIIPMQGHELVANIPQADLAVCGPLARSAEDLATALNVMAGPSPREALGWQLVLPKADFKQLRDLRVAVWATDEIAPVSEEVADRVTRTGEMLSQLGATVSHTARPDFDVQGAHNNYQSLLVAVMSAALPDDQVAALRQFVESLDPGDFSTAAVTARGRVQSHSQWIRTNAAREKLRIAWSQFFNEWDILLCPQMATAAFPHDQSAINERTLTVDGVAQPYMQQLFWAGIVVNAYLPSTVFPTGLNEAGLPIGVQAISAPYRDLRTIEFARQVALESGGFVPPNL